MRSDFLLLAGTNRDLGEAALAGRFRADLLSRINLWSFSLPGLAARREDVEPNLDHETERAAELTGTRVTWSREARARYLTFGVSSEATWPGNFRDLNASVTRLATLAPGGRITAELVDEELGRLRGAWASAEEQGTDDLDLVLGKRAGELDPFDRVQLAEVIRVCRGSRSLSEAGRRLFEKSRTNKKLVNDADRLRKYLARFALTFADTGAR